MTSFWNRDFFFFFLSLNGRLNSGTNFTKLLMKTRARRCRQWQVNSAPRDAPAAPGTAASCGVTSPQSPLLLDYLHVHWLEVTRRSAQLKYLIHRWAFDPAAAPEHNASKIFCPGRGIRPGVLGAESSLRVLSSAFCVLHQEGQPWQRISPRVSSIIPLNFWNISMDSASPR